MTVQVREANPAMPVIGLQHNPPPSSHFAHSNPIDKVVTKLLLHYCVTLEPSLVLRELNHDLTSNMFFLYLGSMDRKTSDREDPPIGSYKLAQADTQ